MAVTTYPVRNGANAGSSGAGATDIRKLANWFKGGVAGKKVVWSGDSTTEQLAGIDYVPYVGGPGPMGSWFPELASVTHLNRGLNGALFQGFVNAGSGGASAGGVNTNLDDIAALKADAYVISWGLNDFRGGFTPGGANPDWRSAYGSAGQQATALLMQTYMRTVITRIRAQAPNAVIIFREPNVATVGCSFLANGVSAQHMADVLRLGYRGDVLLGIPSPESFAEGVIVFKAMSVVYSTTAPPTDMPLLTIPSDGLHPNSKGYDYICWTICSALAGPTADSLASAADARRAAAIERGTYHGHAPSDIAAVVDGSDWRRVYSCSIGAANGSFVDMGFGPATASNDHAWGGNISESLGNDGPPGLAIGDIIVWGSGPTAYMRPVTVLPDAHAGPLRYFSGVDIHGRALPSGFVDGEQGAVYRNRFANSVAARRNATEALGVPAQRQRAYKQAYQFVVTGATDGTLTVRAIGGEFAANGNHASNHTWTATDVLCLTGVDGGGIDGSYGLLLTGATFGVNGLAVTVTLASIDFRPYAGAQGILLSNT